jgi:hypothetical protein
VGVKIGSIYSQLRRKSGSEVLKRVGSVLCSNVIGRRAGGQVRLGRARRDGRRVRGGLAIGVRMSLTMLD